MFFLDHKGEKIEVLTLDLHQWKPPPNHSWSSYFLDVS